MLKENALIIPPVSDVFSPHHLLSFGTRRNDGERVRETALPFTSRRLFAGMPGAQATARQRRRDRSGRCKPGFCVRDGSPPGRRQLRWLRSRQPAPPGDAQERHRQENNKTDSNQDSSNQNQNRREKRIITGKVMCKRQRSTVLTLIYW